MREHAHAHPENRDGAQDVSDGVCLLLFLFAGGDAQCADGADADDSGVIEITDAIFLLSHVFLGGGPPRLRTPAFSPDGALFPMRAGFCAVFPARSHGR